MDNGESTAYQWAFMLAANAAIVSGLVAFFVYRAYRFFRRQTLLGELVFRTKMTWNLLVVGNVFGLIAMNSIVIWQLYSVVGRIAEMRRVDLPDITPWTMMMPACLAVIGSVAFFLAVTPWAGRLEIRRRGFFASGTWDIPWSRVRQVVFGKRSRAYIEHEAGISWVDYPKSQRLEIIAALREAGVAAVEDSNYRFPFFRNLWTSLRSRVTAAILTVGLAVFLAVVAGFYVSLGPEFAAAARLKEAGAKVDGVLFHFWSVAFEEGTRPTEEQLKLLHEFPQLDWLDFAETRLDDSVTGPLDGLTGLVNLDLSGTQIGDKTLARLSGMQSLSRLNLSETRVTGEGLSSIEGLRGVKSLNLRGTKMTPAGTESIGHLLNLQTLVLSETPVEDVWLTPLTSLPHLKNLRLEKTGVTDAGVKTLAQSESLQGLQGLSLSGTQITDAAAEALTQFKGLSWLELNATRLGDAAVEALTRHDSLRDLSLDDTQITDRAVTALAGMDNLKELHLAGTHITDASVDALKRMTHLSYLDIRDTDLSPEKAAEVADALFEARVEWGEREEPEP